MEAKTSRRRRRRLFSYSMCQTNEKNNQYSFVLEISLSVVGRSLPCGKVRVHGFWDNLLFLRRSADDTRINEFPDNFWDDPTEDATDRLKKIILNR